MIHPSTPGAGDREGGEPFASLRGAARLKPYMGFDGEMGSTEGACLVFARGVQEAKGVAFPILSGWGCEFLDVRVRLIQDGDHLFAEANQEKLSQGIPHAIESPRTCRICDLWGEYIDANEVCDNCRDDIEDEAEGLPEASSPKGPLPATPEVTP